MTAPYQFRVDTCGSFLRSSELLQAREKFRKNEITKKDLQEIEDRSIKALVEKQIKSGLKIVTDGELRRSDFVSDFQAGFLGTHQEPVTEEGLKTGVSIPFVHITGKFEANPSHPELAGFDFLKSILPADVAPKILVPSPSYFVSVRKPGDPLPGSYKTEDELFADISKAFRDQILLFYQHGCKYIQIDDPSIFVNPMIAFKGDPGGQIKLFKHLVDISTRLLIPALKDLPDDLHLLYHVCRGNNPIWMFRPPFSYADLITYISDINPSASLLEYDDDRSGSFEPLQKIHAAHPNQVILLGVVTTKRGALEPDEVVEARIREASKYVPLDKLGLCPQCGFGTVAQAHSVTEEEQWKKIDLLVRVAKKVWGSA